MDSQGVAEVGWAGLRYALPRFPDGRIGMNEAQCDRQAVRGRARAALPLMLGAASCGRGTDVPHRRGSPRAPSAVTPPRPRPRARPQFCDFAVLRTLYQLYPAACDLLRLA